MAGQVANLESAVEQLEDAVAIVNARGELLFANPAMRELTAERGARRRRSPRFCRPIIRCGGCRSRRWPAVNRMARCQAAFADRGERLVTTHRNQRSEGRAGRDDGHRPQPAAFDQVQSTVRYSRKLAALGRLSAGVAHEVKNPLNAMMIHLELLRQQVASAGGLAVRRLATSDARSS